LISLDEGLDTESSRGFINDFKSESEDDFFILFSLLLYQSAY
jgi:hypothetical protein